MSLILRQIKGEKLTIPEMDGNLTYLESLATSNSGSNYEQTIGSQTTILSGNTGTIVSVSITINNHPVLVTVTGDANNITAGGWCQIQLYRDGNPIGNIVQCESSGSNENVPYSISYVDEPGTGTFTYTLEAVAVNASDFVFGEADGPVISAIELVAGSGSGFEETNNSVTDSTYSNSKGGEYNSICCSRNSTIIGGSSNEIFGSYYNQVCDSGIFGGRNNKICESDQSVIIGGCDNEICTNDDYNAIIAGCYNRICGGVDYSAIVGGACNVIYGDADADYSAIIAGCYNQNCYSEHGVILGGACNRLLDSSDRSAILAGYQNCIEYNSCDSTIVGGYCNCIQCDSCHSTIIGGYDNCICGNSCNSTILGSYDSCMCCNVKTSSIISGFDHCMRGGFSYYTSPTAPYTQYCTTGFVCASSMLAGCDNRIINEVRNSVIIGGRDNGICGTVCQSGLSSYTCFTCDSAIISSQDSCIINSCKSTVIGSFEGRIFGSCFSQIIGSLAYYYGCNEIISSKASSIISSCHYDGLYICDSNMSSIIATGDDTSICNSTNVVIIGASEGFIDNSNSSFILGGYDNCLVNVSLSGILGGYYNGILNTSNSSTIVGGRFNRICGNSNYSSIIGGSSNDILCNVEKSAIIGGNNNRICGYGTCVRNVTIIGGDYNQIFGSDCSSIISGFSNSMTASNNSVIIGGSCFSLDSCSDVVMVPKLITGTFGSMASWKLGATASTVGATVQTDQYIEVEVNGITYKLALIS